MINSSSSIRNSTASSARGKRRQLPRSAIAVAVALTLAGATAVAKLTPTLPDTSPLVIENASIRPPASFGPLVERVRSAVVNVAVSRKSGSITKGSMPTFEMPADPYFKDFFERFYRHQPALPERPDAAPGVQAVGSGFIVTANGYVVTSNHVIENASEIHVVLNDGKRLPAQVRGRDAKTDLALLKIEPEQKLPYVIFGDSDLARAGDWVVAIGNPFGLGGTATTGIISARGRDIQNGPYDDYLQIDAPINRGNSGGPLFDLTGRVIGVNTAIFSPNGGNVGIGFAVPASQAKSVIEQLMSKGYVERGWLGVQIQKLNDSLAERMQLPDAKGAMVTRVTPKSPASKADLEVGDIILEFNNQQVSEMKDLPKLVANAAPGEKVELVVWREGKKLNLEVSIERLPVETEKVAEFTNETMQGGKLGLRLAPITTELRERFDVPGDVDGALVVDIEPGSHAARDGIQRGDVILQADGKWVTEPADVAKAVRAADATDQEKLLLLVNRQGDQHFVFVRFS